MGHNTQRDGQARFIRPHYYQSETMLVGPQRARRSATGRTLPAAPICVTVGNGSNAELVSHDARLMLFDEAGVLPDRLKDETCTLAAQDDSFFAYLFHRSGLRRAHSSRSSALPRCRGAWRWRATAATSSPARST